MLIVSHNLFCCCAFALCGGVLDEANGADGPRPVGVEIHSN